MMGDWKRTQGRVAVTQLELANLGIGNTVSTTVVNVPVKKQSFDFDSGDYTADGNLFYVDVAHNLNSETFIWQVSNRHTGQDLNVAKVDRITDRNSMRLWMTYAAPIRVTVI